MRRIFLTLATAALTLAGCTPNSSGDNITNHVIDFEGVPLNEQGFSYGKDTGSTDATNQYSIHRSYLPYIEGFDTWMQTEPYFTWWGWAVSNNVSAEYQSDYSHQYACPIAPPSGQNFAVCYFSDYSKELYRPSINFDSGCDIKPISLRVANSTTVTCYTSGEDSFGQWEADDRLTLIIKGYRHNALVFEKEVTLAEGNTLLQGWQEVDLTCDQFITRLEFSFSTTDVSDWGINAPTYVCIDDLKFQMYSYYE